MKKKRVTLPQKERRRREGRKGGNTNRNYGREKCFFLGTPKNRERSHKRGAATELERVKPQSDFTMRKYFVYFASRPQKKVLRDTGDMKCA